MLYLAWPPPEPLPQIRVTWLLHECIIRTVQIDLDEVGLVNPSSLSAGQPCSNLQILKQCQWSLIIASKNCFGYWACPFPHPSSHKICWHHDSWEGNYRRSMSLPLSKPHWLGKEVRMSSFHISLSTQVFSFPTETQSPKKEVKTGLSHRLGVKWLLSEIPAWPVVSLSLNLYGILVTP